MKRTKSHDYPGKPGSAEVPEVSGDPAPAFLGNPGGFPDLSPAESLERWELWLPLPVPKKNGRQGNGAPSWAYRAWEGRAWEALQSQDRPAAPLCRARVTLVLDPRSRSRDLDNALASVHDLLVLAELLLDDGMMILSEVRGIVRNLDPIPDHAPGAGIAADLCFVLLERIR